VTRVLRWEEGELTIRPPSAPQGKVVPAIRIWVPRGDKPTEPPYWDITATTTHPTLAAILDGIIARGSWLHIQKFGVAPRARFTVSELPASYPGPAKVTLR